MQAGHLSKGDLAPQLQRFQDRRLIQVHLHNRIPALFANQQVFFEWGDFRFREAQAEAESRRKEIGYYEEAACSRQEVRSNQKTERHVLAKMKLHTTLVNDLFNTEVVGKRNIAALDDVYTSDARLLPPGAPMISGREAIKRFWADLIQSVNAKSAVLTSVEVMPSGDGVVEIGRATLTVELPGQPEAQAEVKYVVYWRQEGGQWKWHVDIWNQNS